MLSPAPRAALYVRVSKSDGSQTSANQLPELQAVAAARGVTIVATYSDAESAMRRRPAFERMMADARRGSFDVVFVWALDRLGRGFECLDTYRSLAAMNVRVLSLREPWTQVEGPARDLLVSVMSWVSGFERQRLIERTRAGMARARAQGHRIGRPPVIVDLRRAVELRDRGQGARAIARALGVGATTVRKALRAHDDLRRNGATESVDSARKGGAVLDGVSTRLLGVV